MASARLSPQLLEILACPVPACRGKLEQRDDRLVCAGCRRAYRIDDGRPVLIPEEAECPEPGQD